MPHAIGCDLPLPCLCLFLTKRKKWKKIFGSTQIRTVIKGSRVLYTSHYTIEPQYIFFSFFSCFLVGSFSHRFLKRATEKTLYCCCCRFLSFCPFLFVFITNTVNQVTPISEDLRFKTFQWDDRIASLVEEKLEQHGNNRKEETQRNLTLYT